MNCLSFSGITTFFTCCAVALVVLVTVARLERIAGPTKGIFPCFLEGSCSIVRGFQFN